MNSNGMRFQITANMGKHPHNFVGDYFYQEARKDFLDIYQLATRIKWVLDTLEANRPEAAAPPYIFVLRNGLSEGQFTVVNIFCEFMIS